MSGERKLKKRWPKPEEIQHIELTPQMIQAGVAELREKTLGEPLEDVVYDVFQQMWLERFYWTSEEDSSSSDS